MEVKNTKPEDVIQPYKKTPCCHTHQILFIAVPSSRFEVISFPAITPAEMLFQDITSAVIRGILILVMHLLFQSHYVVSLISGNNYMPLHFTLCLDELMACHCLSRQKINSYCLFSQVLHYFTLFHPCLYSPMKSIFPKWHHSM